MKFTEEQINFLDKKLELLSKSKFRSSFRLKDKELAVIRNKGIDVVCSHARDFVHTRLGQKIILNDGKQTPMRGHPVFVAQHATATCCRGCLEKWHHIRKDKELTEREERFIVGLIMYWIERNIS